MTTYKIWRLGDDEETAETIDELNAGFAVESYAEICDQNSNYVDGYPDGDEINVRNMETGELEIYKLYTDFDPSFVAFKK